MDESVIERAKQAARARNTSVSAMLAGLVRGLDALDHARGADFIGPLTRAATGLVELGPAARTPISWVMPSGSATATPDHPRGLVRELSASARDECRGDH
jgi:hypothetical protein